MRDDLIRLIRSGVKALDALRSSIDKNTDAAQMQRSRADSTSDLTTITTVQPEITLPPAVQGYYEAEQRERPSKNRWERAKRFIETVAFLAALAAAFFTYKTLKQVQRQADAAQAQVEIMRNSQSAPWVGLEQNSVLPINSPQYAWSPALSYPTIYVTLQYSIKNFGNAPAFRVDSFSTFPPVTDPGPVGGPDFPDPCVMAETRQAASEKVQLGQVIFPGAAIPIEFGTNLSADPQKLKTLKRVWINFCIAYQDSDKTRWHHSKFTFISRPADGQIVTFPQHPGWSYLPFTGVNLIAASAN